MTEKLYYKNQFLSVCKGKLLEINEKGLIFDKTVAYPEGGGQIGDSGILIREKTKEEFEFFDTTKRLIIELSEIDNFSKLYGEINE